MYRIILNNKDNLIFKDGNIVFKNKLASILTFTINIENEFFNKLNKFKDYIEVWDDDELIFDGRVLLIEKEMDSDGNHLNIVTCESVLNYLNDTRTDSWEFYPVDIPVEHGLLSFGNCTKKFFVNKILDNHNSKVDDKRKILPGTLELDGLVEIKTNYETSLSSLQAYIFNDNNIYLRLRKENSLYYLDILKENPIKDIVKIELGENLERISIKEDFNIFTRLIPLGKDNLTIESVNNNIKYLDSDLVNEYGIIENVLQWPDITIPENLLNKAKEVLKEIEKNATVNLDALDLSYIDGNFKKLKLNMNVNVIKDYLEYNKMHEIVAITLNLNEPWKSTFDLNKETGGLSNSINSVEQKTNSNKIEIVSLGNKLITKVSNSDFETYRVQTEKEISEKVSEGNLSTIVRQNAKEWGLSIDGELETKNYVFNKDGFWISGKNGGCELTDTYAKWKDNKGNVFSVGATGFFKEVNGVYGDLKYFNFITRRSRCKNGEIEYIQLPNNFRNKKLDKDFSVYTLWDGIDSNLDARFKLDALRNIYIKIVNWNPDTAVLAVQPCIQKIGLKTNTFFGWDESSTTPGNPIGEGSMDIIVIIAL